MHAAASIPMATARDAGTSRDRPASENEAILLRAEKVELKIISCPMFSNKEHLPEHCAELPASAAPQSGAVSQASASEPAIDSAALFLFFA